MINMLQRSSKHIKENLMIYENNHQECMISNNLLEDKNNTIL
jgi:hypothetical protein